MYLALPNILILLFRKMRSYINFNSRILFFLIIFSSPLSIPRSHAKPQSGTTSITNLNRISALTSTSSNNSSGVIASWMELGPGGYGVPSVVKDIFNRIGAYSLLSFAGSGGKVSGDPNPKKPIGQFGMPQEVLKDIFVTLSHYSQRNDLNSLENLENIALEILNGYTEKEKDSVFFYLYNRNTEGSEVIKYGSLNQLKKSNFTIGKPVKILIHGYRMNGFSHFNYLLKEAYLKHGEETNVINVDWRRLAGDYVYFNSAFNTRIVGERVGELVVLLKRNGFITSYDQVHLVGFSLGAHVAGYTGKYLMKTERQQLARITGLDPAGPSFVGGVTSDSRLDQGDAKFVDVIHSSSGRSGIVESIGHVDFRPNGGADQPGCDLERITDYFLRNCSHERSFYLYLETIKKPKKFLGCPCPSWEDYLAKKCKCKVGVPGAEYMGEYCNSTARGDKYLYIKDAYPIVPVA